MARKQGETHREYKARMIDPVSESFCGAKWYNATIWLGHGGTTSCHHPPAHQIDLEEIKTNEISQLSKRPKFAITNKTKIISAFNLKIPDWKESLMKFLKNI